MDACKLPDPARLERRGVLWMIGAFVFCPCHLPITLGVLALMLGGTAAGALLSHHPYLAATMTHLMRYREHCSFYLAPAFLLGLYLTWAGFGMSLTRNH